MQYLSGWLVIPSASPTFGYYFLINLFFFNCVVCSRPKVPKTSKCCWTKTRLSRLDCNTCRRNTHSGLIDGWCKLWWSCTCLPFAYSLCSPWERMKVVITKLREILKVTLYKKTKDETTQKRETKRINCVILWKIGFKARPSNQTFIVPFWACFDRASRMIKCIGC